MTWLSLYTLQLNSFSYRCLHEPNLVYFALLVICWPQELTNKTALVGFTLSYAQRPVHELLGYNHQKTAQIFP